MEFIRRSLNPPITEEEIKSLNIKIEQTEDGGMVHFSFRGERLSMPCEYSGNETAISILDKIGFEGPNF